MLRRKTTKTMRILNLKRHNYTRIRHRHRKNVSLESSFQMYLTPSPHAQRSMLMAPKSIYVVSEERTPGVERDERGC